MPCRGDTAPAISFCTLRLQRTPPCRILLFVSPLFVSICSGSTSRVHLESTKSIELEFLNPRDRATFRCLYLRHSSSNATFSRVEAVCFLCDVSPPISRYCFHMINLCEYIPQSLWTQVTAFRLLNAMVNGFVQHVCGWLTYDVRKVCFL